MDGMLVPPPTGPALSDQPTFPSVPVQIPESSIPNLGINASPPTLKLSRGARLKLRMSRKLLKVATAISPVAVPDIPTSVNDAADALPSGRGVCLEHPGRKPRRSPIKKIRKTAKKYGQIVMDVL